MSASSKIPTYSTLGAAAFAVALVCNGAASAQWLDFPTPGIPRTADGQPNLSARAPRTRDGRPDLSGLWRKVGDKFANNIEIGRAHV